PFLTMTEGANSSYSASVSMTGIEIGDKIKYKIVAVDQAAVPNYTNEPASGVHEVNVVGLGPTIDSYANNFDATSGDFFGEGFSMTTPAGFANGAIHTDHPYKQGNGFPNDKLNLTYQLSSPIRVKDEEATIKFDEIVLVEPGEPGSVFGSENFFDYVVVEGSIDGGVTWKPVADGYDSRDNNDWLTLYNSTIVDNSSTGVGNPSLYRTRTMDLLQKFAAGDEVAIRFRLFSDPFARGWGWAIDNLKIQIDETMPTVLNDHVDYIVHGTTTTLPITTKVTDASGVKTLKIEYSVNDGTAEMVDFPVVFNQNEYTLNLGLDNLTAGTKVSYRIVAKDSADNVGIFPPTGYVNVPLIALSSPVSEYVNNFDDPTPDFVGNFFTIEKPSGFSNAAIHSTHFYYNGMGLDKTSDFTFTLKKPITLTSTNHYMQFDEIAIVEGHPQAAVFGTPAFSDYVIVEGSKDGAVTWKKFLDGYDAQEKASWVVAYNNKTSGTSGHYNSRTIDLTASNDFKSGDNVLIRFRMFVDDKNNGWGWSIDNLSIQGPITGVETVSQAEIKLFPNPTAQLITIEMQSMREVPVTIYNQQGVTVYRDVIAGHSTVAHKEINVSEFAEGLYLVKAEVNGKLIVRKFLKVK
ncbi:MAG: T9SS type A sorting domain-containing protein, partial [Bacteroidota bacterium]